VIDRIWRGTGPTLSLDLRSVSLSLNVEQANPGLELPEAHGTARLLALDGLAQAGRYDRMAFGPRTLVAWELVRGRLAATYTPAGWGGLIVRAAWSPISGRDGVDLEIQASADSAAELKHVEVVVSSEWVKGDSGFSGALASRVACRDARGAVQSDESRDPAAVLSSLTTPRLAAASATALEPLVAAAPGAGRSVYYVEMVQPDDVARRIIGIPADDRTTSQLVLSVHYGLLGHDIEKGVILRARLRGQWIESETPEDEAQALWRQFRDEPLPLGP